MKLKEMFDKLTDFIDNNRGNITRLLLSILAFIALIIVLFISNDEISIGKEVDHLVSNIENRKYQIAYNYYEDLKEEFSTSKMKRFNKSASNKINTVVINNGDRYINGDINKEQFIGIINTVNALSQININIDSILEQSKRVNDMYLEENIDYDKALSYILAASSLNCINDELDEYVQNIKDINTSRAVYEEATQNQHIKKYYEAIEGYEKVLEIDKKYYKLSKLAKEECINLMYDYYIQKAEYANENGNYDEAIKYIGYLKNYYNNDEKLAELESKYQENLSIYTMTQDDILNLIANKMGSKDGITISTFQQMINGGKFYYVELYKYNNLIDEIIVDAKTRKIYSYKSFEKDYNANYSDGYFKINSNGEFRFALGKGECMYALENKLKEKEVLYKDLEIITKEDSKKYITNEDVVEDFISANKSAYYYVLANKGFFKKKELYLIDMYTKKIYLVGNDEVINY